MSPLKTLVAMTLVASTMSLVSAQETPLFRLARQYQAEVKAFEASVLAVRGVDRVDERLVDQLDDESGRLILAAKNPRHFNRLFHQWRKVQAVSRRTESTLFGKYTPNHDWIGNWDRVLLAESLFAEEFVLSVENPGHDNSVRRLDRPSTRRDNYLGEPIPVE